MNVRMDDDQPTDHEMRGKIIIEEVMTRPSINEGNIGLVSLGC